MRERFGLLFKHFGIDEAAPDKWKHLAVALALKHEPGFQISKHGRPRGKPGNLVVRFEALRLNTLGHKRTNPKIAEIIAKEDGDKAATVLRRYNSEKKTMREAERKRREAERGPMLVMTPQGPIEVHLPTIKPTILGGGK